MNEYKGIMLTKIELTLEQSQQGVSNDVLMEILLEPTSNKLLVGTNDGVAASFQQSPIHYHMLMKTQELKTKTSANSDIKDNSSETKLQGRLLASFQEDAKYEHVGQDTRSQGGKDDQDIQGKDLKISDTKDSRTQRQSNLKKFKEARFKISPQEFEDHTLGEIISLKYVCEHGSSESAGSLALRKIVDLKITSLT
ncbi:hypothetical protein Tco_0662958 [Tanacetum coccineum]